MQSMIRTNIRSKLILSLVSVVLITGVASILIGSKLINENIIGQAYENVQGDLNTAQYIYDFKINTIHLFMKHLSSLPYLKTAILNRDRALLANKLRDVKEELNLDILNIADPEGRIIIRAKNPGSYGDLVKNDDYIAYVSAHRKSCNGSDIITGEQLKREGGDLALQAWIKAIPTKMSRTDVKDYEDKGLLLKAAAPIFYKGKLIGIVYGATLLNKNYEIVDRIKSLVFKDEKYDGYDLGTATIFLDDLRISTNVKRINGERAIGTRVSEEVYDKVVRKQKLWKDRAFVVNNWYLSAYSPIYNLKKKVVGILYVGILEEKLNQMQRKTTLFFLIIMVVTAQIAIILAVYLIQNIVHPINNLLDASREIVKGNYNFKILATSRDELGYLCQTYNSMIEAIVERDNKLKEQTQKQILQTEKLASLGRLASGIAHEINNPLTGVLTYSSILLEELKDSEYREDLEVIVKETMRCRNIVKGILDFARETKLEKTLNNINGIITETLSILEKHVNFQNITIIRDLAPGIPNSYMDVNQIKSVINNLAVNAADAMPVNGRLHITTELDQEGRTIIITVADNGTGIEEENLNRIFDPFFTTKDTGKGTGLGLAVTYGIIQRHNGTIEVKSIPGQGTTFTIKLPVTAG